MAQAEEAKMSDEPPVYVQWGDLFLPSGQAFEMGAVGCLVLFFFCLPLFYLWAVYKLITVLEGFFCATSRKEWKIAWRHFWMMLVVLLMMVAAYPFLLFWWELVRMIF